MKISVIIPAYNEEKRVEKTILAISSYMRENFDDYEILIVDDGSRDNTKGVVEKYTNDKIKLLSYGENRGKGGAVKYGILNSSGDFAVFTDADLPYPPSAIKEAVKILNETDSDFILGARKQAENGEKYPLLRRIMSFGFSVMVKLILKLNVPDTQCGFKAFKSACAKDIFSKTRVFGWGFDVEAIFIAVKSGYSFRRLAVELTHDDEGSKINAARDALKMIGELKIIKKNNKNGMYD